MCPPLPSLTRCKPTHSSQTLDPNHHLFLGAAVKVVISQLVTDADRELDDVGAVGDGERSNHILTLAQVDSFEILLWFVLM